MVYWAILSINNLDWDLALGSVVLEGGGSYSYKDVFVYALSMVVNRFTNNTIIAQ